MINGGNLPEKVQYGSKIKEITIAALPVTNSAVIGNENRYYIKFTEIIESEEEYKAFLFFKKKHIITSEKEHIVPFSFKSLEIAKDFAQYIPNMKIFGNRLYSPFEQYNKRLLYETYELNIDGLADHVLIKFMKECEHPNTIKKRRDKDDETCTEYYINDLDKKFLNGTQGNFYNYAELVVDKFFKLAVFSLDNLCLSNSKFDAADPYETISEIKDFESKTIHKFVLIENENK